MMHIVILLLLVLDLFLPWIMKLLSSFYSSFDFGTSFSLENGIIFLLWMQFACFNDECYCSEEKHIVAQQVESFCFYFFFGYNLCLFSTLTNSKWTWDTNDPPSQIPPHRIKIMLKEVVWQLTVTFLPQNISSFTTTKLQAIFLRHHAWMEFFFFHPL
jgi:hypothetical protein